jgi:hypothetical protein
MIPSVIIKLNLSKEFYLDALMFQFVAWSLECNINLQIEAIIKICALKICNRHGFTFPDRLSPSKNKNSLSFFPSSVLTSAVLLVAAPSRIMSISALCPNPKKL